MGLLRQAKSHHDDKNYAIKVRVADRGDLSAQLVGVSPCDDLAVIRVPGSGFAKAQFGDSNDLKLGEDVMVTGYPLGQPDLSATRGIVSKLHVTLDQLQDLIQTDASVNPGNSGGPLLNMQGEVVGIITIKVQYDQAGNPIEGTAFAISSNLANELVPELAAGNNRDWLGLNTIPLKDIDADLEGLLVVGVSDNSPAERAGLQPRDVLLTMGGVRVNSKAELCNIVRALGPGDILSYEVVRDGQTVSSERPRAPSSEPRATPTAGLIAAFEDDFSDPASGWSEHIDDIAEKILLQVQVEQVEGPDRSLHGVIFSHQDSRHYYLFVIRGDGYYAILKNEDGLEYLVDWTPSEHINPRPGGNSLAVLAEGSLISVFINGEFVDLVGDDSFPTGSVGLAVGTFPDEAGAPLVYFDNVQVRAADR